MNNIVWGIATRWDPENCQLIVRLDDTSYGIVPENELTIYPESYKDNYSKSASYCVGVKLKYVVISQNEGKLLLSRKALAENTLSRLKGEMFHDYVNGIITGVEEKNIFLDIDGVYGICSASDLSYTYITNCGLVFERGESFDFTISAIKNDKLILSRVGALPSKDTLLKSYPTNSIITGRLLAPVNSKLDSPNIRSWFFINKDRISSDVTDEKSIPGIVEIPSKNFVKPGMDVGVVVTRINERDGHPIGLRGNLTVR